MRSIILGLFCIFSAFQSAGQASVAKLKYEDAEAAFSQNDYKTTLVKLDEAEKLLGSSNPRILYLRILAENKIFEADPYQSFSRLNYLRKNCASYMKQTENNKGVEEKIREIYTISESLQAYPSSEEAFNAKKTESDNKKKIENSKKELLNTLVFFGDSLCNMLKYKPNIGRSEFLSYNPYFNSMKLQVIADNGSLYGFPITTYGRKTSSLSIKQNYEPGATGYTTDTNDKVIGYGFTFVGGSGKMEDVNSQYEIITQSFRNLSSRYQVEKSKSAYGVSSTQMVISIPDKNNPDQVSYYVAFSKSHYKNVSSLSIQFSTREQLAFFWINM